MLFSSPSRCSILGSFTRYFRMRQLYTCMFVLVISTLLIFPVLEVQAQEYALEWTNLVECASNGEGDLWKTSSTGNGGASSVTTFVGDGKVEYTLSSSPLGIHFGLSDSDPDVVYNNIDYDIYVGTGNSVAVYENGAVRNTGTH